MNKIHVILPNAAKAAKKGKGKKKVVEKLIGHANKVKKVRNLLQKRGMNPNNADVEAYVQLLVNPWLCNGATIPDSSIYKGQGVGDELEITLAGVVDGAGGTSTASAAGILIQTCPNAAYRTLATYNATTGAITWNANTVHPLYTGSILPSFCAQRPVAFGGSLGWVDALENAQGTYFALFLGSGPAGSTTAGVAPDNTVQVTGNPNSKVLLGANVEEGMVRETWLPDGTVESLLELDINGTSLRGGMILLFWIGSLKSGTAASSPVMYNHQVSMAHNWEMIPDAANELLFPSRLNTEGSPDVLNTALKKAYSMLENVGSTTKSAAEMFIRYGPAWFKAMTGAGRLGRSMLSAFGLLTREERLLFAVAHSVSGQKLLSSLGFDLSRFCRDLASRSSRLVISCPGFETGGVEEKEALESIHESEFTSVSPFQPAGQVGSVQAGSASLVRPGHFLSNGLPRTQSRSASLGGTGS